jgi:hypothetical protein
MQATKTKTEKQTKFAFAQLGDNGSTEWTGYAVVLAADSLHDAEIALREKLRAEGAATAYISLVTGAILEDGHAQGRMWVHLFTEPLDWQGVTAAGPGSYFRAIPHASPEEPRVDPAIEALPPVPEPPVELFWTDGRIDPETGVQDWFPLERESGVPWEFATLAEAREVAELFLLLPTIAAITLVQDGEMVAVERAAVR